MARTGTELLTSVRVSISDVDADRLSDPTLLGYAVDGINFLLQQRPDLFMGKFLTEFETLAAGDPLPVPSRYFRPLVDYVIGRAELNDDESAVSGRAELAAKLAQGFIS